jgi:hypothetical protein
VTLFHDPERNWRYVHRFERLLNADPMLLREAIADEAKSNWGRDLSTIPERYKRLFMALLWLTNRRIDHGLVLSFRGSEFTGEDLRVMFTAGLTDEEIRLHRDTGMRPHAGLTVLAAMRPRPFDPLALTPAELDAEAARN